MMATGVLVDTSVWVQHWRVGLPELVGLLEQDRVWVHPYVVAEVACGTPPQRQQTLLWLQCLHQIPGVPMAQVLQAIERGHWWGRGCGWVDISLLAATTSRPGLQLWTLDRRLAALAQTAGVAYQRITH